MNVVIKHEVKPIKNGYMATARAMKVAAQGYNEETAKANLERTVRLLLAPLEREGVLEDELHKMGIEMEAPSERGLTISFA